MELILGHKPWGFMDIPSMVFNCVPLSLKELVTMGKFSKCHKSCQWKLLLGDTLSSCGGSASCIPVVGNIELCHLSVRIHFVGTGGFEKDSKCSCLIVDECYPIPQNNTPLFRIVILKEQGVVPSLSQHLLLNILPAEIWRAPILWTLKTVTSWFFSQALIGR